MTGKFRFLLRPGWVALSVLTVALVVTMVLLGRWQLTRSEERHFNIQNFGYALQWWAFSVFTLAMWARLVRDHLRHPDGGAPAEAAPPTSAPVAYRRYVPPAPATSDDPELAAYNDYLAQLSQKDGHDQ